MPVYRGRVDADAALAYAHAANDRNPHGSETIEADVTLERFAAKSIEHTIIRHDDLEACNTKDAPDNVSPVKGNGASLDSKGLALKLPPHSYSMVRVTL